MTETPPDGPAQLDIRPARERAAPRLSLVWIVPLVALAVSLWAAWQSYADRGTLITISFENASGVVAGETKIKYRDVEVGEVERVEFSEGLTDVLVHARKVGLFDYLALLDIIYQFFPCHPASSRKF